MAGGTSSSAPIDPLRELRGPALFPRTVIESGGLQVPADSRDLDSIHLFMKSMELRNPEKLLNEAKRIVHGGAELLDSNISSFAENISVENAMASKPKDRPQERRPGLGIARKRASFSYTATLSQIPVREPNMDIAQLQDPDDFFDAYERLENAEKEIQKQVGGNWDTVNQQRPSLVRSQRPGILGKSYSYRHQYSSNPSHNDEVLVPFQELEQVISKTPTADSLKKAVSPGSVPSTDAENVEQSGTRTDKFSKILDELLSCNNGDLDEEGALNLVKERLNIQALDLESLNIPDVHDVGSTSSPVPRQSLSGHRDELAATHKVLGDEQQAQNQNNIATSPASRSPLSSLASLMKRVMKFNPLKDSSSPVAVDLFSSKDGSIVQATDKLSEQVHASTVTSLTHLDSRAEIAISEPLIPNIDAVRMPETSGSLSGQPVDRTIGLENENCSNKPVKESDLNTDAVQNDDHSHETQSDHRDHPVLGDDAVVVASKQNKVGLEKQVPQKKPHAHKIAGEKRSRSAYTTGSHSVGGDHQDHSIPEDDARVGTSQPNHVDIEKQVPQKEPHARKITGEKRIRNAHPMRKSLAECGSSFENGVRRSKRIKMRPLEYWKGERLLYGRVHDSLKLIGVRCFSPGNGDATLKVKPYISSDTLEMKELLDWAARH